ncbi:MAG: peptidoglycan recognition protein family protein [Candidatus Omnitrophica bacterium]|nr:peptidoglycan recognition protein family protein [Candidatus Omnitrophota bacterium]
MVLKFGEKRKETKYIIIHHFGVEVSYFGNIKLEKQAVENAYSKHPEFFYHYVILSNGEIIKKHPDDIVVYHANNNEINNTSIAICLFGSFNKREPTKLQLDVLIGLIKNLMSKYNIPPKNVLGHRDVGDSYTDCPGNVLYNMLPKIRLELTPKDWKRDVLEWATNIGLIKSPQQHENLDTYFTKAEILALLKNLMEVIKRNGLG